MLKRDALLRSIVVASIASTGFLSFVASVDANNNVSSSTAAAPIAALKNLEPAEKPIAAVIDLYVDQKLAAAKVKPSPPADDANLLRRIMLDLVGRVPTPLEVKEFVESKAPNKTELLVDRLIASEAFVDHQVNEFDWLLNEGKGTLRPYLADAFRERYGWDRIFRDLILAEGASKDDKKAQGHEAVEFLKPRMKDHDRLTNDVSSLFFGVNISCAQCHDHPLAKDWKQDHFYGLKSFLARTYENGGFVGERDYGLVNYLTPAGESRQAKLMFLTGHTPDEPKRDEPDNKAKKAEQEMLKKLADKKQAPPKPSFSRRQLLVNTALGNGQRDVFARSIVNRLWARFFGQGIVSPVDQMHSANPPSHPELLAWLARDMADHNFDLPRLMRGLVLSKAYGRDSRWTAGERPAPELFAVAQVRPLSPHQYAASLRIATADPEMWTKLTDDKTRMQRATSLAGSARSWASSFAPLTDNFQIGVGESLLLANDARIYSEFLSDAGDRLVGRMKTLNTPHEQAELAITTVLGRPADAEETKLLAEYMTGRKDRALEAARQVVWSLLTSSEFRFNY